MREKKVLIIAYYWPPSGGSGVQRWLKFVKYMPQFGWEPYVFTPENPAFATRDESLLNDVPPEAEVLRFPVWEPYDAFFKLSAMFGATKKTARPTELVAANQNGLFQRISTWIRGNLFIPDPRIFWVKPAVNFLHDFIRTNNIKIIITTGPPHSVHLIGLRLKKKNPAVHWLADFRDPWTEWGLLDTLSVSKMARHIHRKLEAKVLQTANVVTTVTPFFVQQLERLGDRKVHLLTNGFDQSDFENLVIRKGKRFVIRHVGIVNERCDPRPFMLALQTLLVRDESFRQLVHLDFTGEVHPEFKTFVEAIPALAAITTFTPAVPHKQLLSMYGDSALLLLVLTGYKDAEGLIPGKLFEYIATGLPVLGVGPVQGDAAVLMKQAGSGVMVAEDDTEGIISAVIENFRQWQIAGPPRVNDSRIKQYSRFALTQRLLDLLH